MPAVFEYENTCGQRFAVLAADGFFLRYCCEGENGDGIVFAHERQKQLFEIYHSLAGRQCVAGNRTHFSWTVFVGSGWRE